MRILASIIFYTFIILLVSKNSFANSHLILKSDFNNDGIADRVVFSSFELSGFVQSTFANKKIDTFFFKQGNRSIFFTSHTSDGVPFAKLTEDAGFYSIVTLMKYENHHFNHVTSYALPGEVYFSDDFFSDSVITTSVNAAECNPKSAFNNKSTSSAKTWAEQLKQHSLEETIKKSIDSSCKKVFGEDYVKLEKEIVAACKIESTPNSKKQNSLIDCLDRNIDTRTTSSLFQRTLASNIFEDDFKVNCENIKVRSPKASFNKTTKSISLYQTSPPEKGRSFKADFFHEMLHSAGIKADDKIQPLIRDCLDLEKIKNIKSDNQRIYISKLDEEVRGRKDGIEVNIPAQVKEIPQTTIASTISEGAKTLDNNFSMENLRQYDSLSKVSKATFKSFDPIMKAAYEAAVPTAFAKDSLASNITTTSSSASITIPTVKAATIASRTIASTSPSVLPGPSYDISSLPDSVATSSTGEIGSGLSVKAAAINIKDDLSRSPSSINDSRETASSAGTMRSSAATSGGSLSRLQTTDRQNLRNNVPRLKEEADFIKTLMTGKYDEVKARLTDPKNQQILEEKRIQYVARERTLGSKQPVMILKDLGNKFSVVRVTIE